MDYLIINGLIIDGSGKDPVEANIGIKGGKIASIGKARLDAKEVIDARGLIVSPGFIDTHTHSEFTLLADARAEAKISQGITTDISGNCGLSAAPLYGEALEQREADLKELDIKERWATFGEYFSLLERKGIAINFATLCGHGNIRASAVGYRNRKPDKKEMDEMKRLFSGSLNEGARGLSTGLIYPPGVYSDTDELIELCKGLNRTSHIAHLKFIYTTHMRSEGDKLIESIEEAIRIGRETDAHIHISHIKTSGKDNWQKIGKAIELMEKAKSEGIKLTCDRYPYIASSTDLDVVLPSWVFEGGRDEGLKRLKDGTTRQKLKSGLSSKSADYWKNISISSVTKDENKWMEGENIFNISQRMGKAVEDAVLDILIDEGLRAGAIFFSMSEENLKRFLSLPYAMVGSDSSARSFSGITRSGKPHPRGFGTFPRFVGKYVRDEGLMPLPEAIRRISHLAAETFGLKQRGLIREGYFADMVLFNYDRIIDRATFNDPFQKAEGIEYVFVNGSLAYKEGRYTGSLSGRVLR
ncbi:MAG: D-aminoacylase [Deltaproteobacteria bacterium]|nr:D-aminoacylase [Deltaproteobacteria bacterium]